MQTLKKEDRCEDSNFGPTWCLALPPSLETVGWNIYFGAHRNQSCNDPESVCLLLGRNIPSRLISALMMLPITLNSQYTQRRETFFQM